LTRARPTAYLSDVFAGLRNLRIPATVLALVAVTGLTGCVHLPPPASAAQINNLRLALTSLHPDIRDAEAGQVATVAYDYPRQLAAEYRLVRPPLLHNLLINLRFKKRGLCYQWAEDMVTKLQTLKLETVELHWGMAGAGKRSEHNTVVVTGPGQPFAEGLVLDPWRRSGELVWRPVAADSYAWQEGELFAPPPPPGGPAQTAMPR